MDISPTYLLVPLWWPSNCKRAQTREVKGDLQPLYDYVLVKSKDRVAGRAMGNPRPGLGKWESDGAIYPLKMVMVWDFMGIYGGLMGSNEI